MSTNTHAAHWLYTIDEWNNNYIDYLDIIFKNNDIKYIYDIGANVGATAYIFKNYCIKNNKNINNIYCFEPDEDNFIFLKKKLENFINNKEIFCVNKGVYYGLKKAKVFGMGLISENKIHENVGGYGIEECIIDIKNVRNNNGEEVFCDQIDNKTFNLETLEVLSKNFYQPDLIKIDIEGAEYNVLKNSTLIKNAKYIIVEWNQPTCFQEFINKHLPMFKIIKSTGDFLIKNINY